MDKKKARTKKRRGYTFICLPLWLLSAVHRQRLIRRYDYPYNQKQKMGSSLTFYKVEKLRREDDPLEKKKRHPFYGCGGGRNEEDPSEPTKEGGTPRIHCNFEG